MLSAVHIHDFTQANWPKRKLELKYLGPFEIEQVISSVVYKLKLLHTLKIHLVFHVSLLKRYQVLINDFTCSTLPPSEIIGESDEPEYKVEDILNSKIYQHKKYYLIK